VAAIADRTGTPGPAPSLAGGPTDEPQPREPDEPQPRRPVDWFRVSGPERLAAWQGLALFVEALVYRYNLQLELRPCWWQHGDAVEELTALWHIRQTSYGDDAALGSAMSWQDQFYKSRDRLRDIFVSCRDGHIDATIHTWMRDDMRQAFHHAVRTDVLGR
jgi:hypothetical protein